MLRINNNDRTESKVYSTDPSSPSKIIETKSLLRVESRFEFLRSMLRQRDPPGDDRINVSRVPTTEPKDRIASEGLAFRL